MHISPNANKRAAEVLVIGAMPFFYGAATRLPFIYFVIHLYLHFHLGWWAVGLCVASYQGCRVIASAVAVFTPKLSHFVGTSAGLAGYIISFVCDEDAFAPFAIGTAIIGLSETMSSMQKFVKEMYKLDKNREKAHVMLRYQYAFVMVGVVVAFLGGGFIYQFKQIKGVALFGIIMESFALIALIAFASLPLEESALPMSTASISTDLEMEVSFSTNNSCAATGQSSLATKDLSFLLDTTDAKYLTSDLPATWLNWLLCLSFGIEALTIGYNLSMGPIFILMEFDKGAGMIGFLFAVGATAGALAAISVTCTEFGKDALKRIATSPFDLCFSMGGIAVGVLVAAVPSFVVHVVGLILLMSFNDLGATLMTELQGSITTVSNYSLFGPLGQAVRRSLNVVTALTGPVLYGVYPRLPHFVAGFTTLLWAILLFVAFKMRIANTLALVSDKTGQTKESV
ncbi:unnamed protein product, partial [Heterosigma akashiwo]